MHILTMINVPSHRQFIVERNAEESMLNVQSYSNFTSATALAHMQAALSDMTRENEEKALLLNEMRHRMKNNLQTIQSMLRLEKTNAASQDTKIQLGHIELYIAALNGVDGELLTTGDTGRKASTLSSSLTMTVPALTAKQQHMRAAPC